MENRGSEWFSTRKEAFLPPLLRRIREARDFSGRWGLGRNVTPAHGGVHDQGPFDVQGDLGGLPGSGGAVIPEVRRHS